MKLTRRGFLAGAGAVAVGSAVWGLDPNRAWADEEVAEEAAGTDEAPAEEPAAPAGPVVVCEECPGACTLVLDVEDGRVAAVHGDGANPFSEGRLCLRAQALTDLWKAPEGTTEDDADDDSGNGAGGNDAASEGATTTSPGRLTSPRVRRAGSDAWEDISWDRALDEIANLVKDTRDATFEESIEGTEADDETQGETGFDEWTGAIAAATATMATATTTTAPGSVPAACRSCALGPSAASAARALWLRSSSCSPRRCDLGAW